jgi:alpha-1,4-digalacturonate transport system substrate-binding protein
MLRRRLRTRAAVVLAFGATATVALTGCVPGPAPVDREPFTGSTTEIDTASFDGRELDYVFFADSDAEEAETRALIADYEAEFGASVNLQVVPYANLEQSLNARLSGTDVPDVARMASNQLPSFTDQTVDLRTYFGEEYAAEFLPGAVTTVRGTDDELWAVPSDLTMNGPFVNVELFEQAGEPIPSADDPWTVDEMIAAAERVQQATGSEFAFAMDKSGHRASGILSAYGTEFIGDDGGAALDVDATEQTITLLTDLMGDERMSRDFWIGTGTAYAGANEMFLAGSAPIYLSGNWQVRQFDEAAGFDWAVAPNPCDERCAGFPGMKVMTVFQRGGDADLAAHFVHWMNDTEQQARIDAAANWLPTRADLTEQGVDYEVRGDEMQVFLDEVATTADVTYASAASAAYKPASLEFVDEVSLVLGDRQSPREAAEAVVAFTEQQVDEQRSRIGGTG